MITNKYNRGTPPNILVTCTELIPSVTVGVLNILRYIQNHCPIIVSYKNFSSINSHDINTADVVVFVRAYTQYELKLLKICKKYGKFVIYYLDDDLLNLPHTSISYSEATQALIHEFLPQIIAHSDILWTPSTVIEKSYRIFNNNTCVSHAPAPKCDSSILQEPYDNAIRIVFAGSIDHQGFLNELLGDVLLQLVKHYNGRVLIYVLGAQPKFCCMSNYIYHIAYIKNFDDYRRKLSGLHIDIGLAPLPNDTFYHSKYFNKFLEYASMGIAGIYSNTRPYTDVVENGNTGLLASNDPLEWKNCLETLINDTCLRKNIVNNAFKQVKENFSLNKVSNDLVQSIPELTCYAAEGGDLSYIDRIKTAALCNLVWYRLTLAWKKYHCLLPIFAVLWAIKNLTKRVAKRNIP